MYRAGSVEYEADEEAGSLDAMVSYSPALDGERRREKN